MNRNFIKSRDNEEKLITLIFGPTAKEFGEDLKKLYIGGRNLILKKVFKKLKNPNDGKIPNLRVAKDVLINGSFTDEEICAEYFGGILASSRSSDGKDDYPIFYLDIIKGLSSDQLRLHYIIYKTLNKILISDNSKRNLNPGNEHEFFKEEVIILIEEDFVNQFKNKDFGFLMHGLNSKGLIGPFEVKNYEINDKFIPYIKVSPTALGVQLFAIAHNKFNEWRKFSTVNFEEFENVILPTFYGQSLAEVIDQYIKLSI